MIVDDHPITREGLGSLIRQAEDFTVCGEAADAEEAISMLLSVKPDLVLTDIALPGRSGIELIKDIHTLDPSLPVMVISMHEETLYAERALRAGARGYMMKQEKGDVLLNAIREVLAGKVHVSSSTSAEVLARISSKRINPASAALPSLSDRELEVFRLIGEGISTAQIGKRLNVSPKTVECHRVNIKAKLGFKSSTRLISFAARWNAAEFTDLRAKKK